jgi:ubiquinone/menaquinone biosynthesis C-methylase UbiE
MTLAAFAKQGSVVAIDVSEMLLGYAQKRAKIRGLHNISFKKMDIFDMDFSPETFDFVYLRLVVQHLPDPLRALKNLRETLKPGEKNLHRRHGQGLVPDPSRAPKMGKNLRAGQGCPEKKGRGPTQWPQARVPIDRSRV